jgi:hypothetical protein
MECERMWIAAQEQIQRLTGMRLRMVTDNRAETFAPTSLRQMTGGSVTKYPVADGVYEFRADIYCYGRSGCPSLSASGVNAFNASVGLAADRPWEKKATTPAN